MAPIWAKYHFIRLCEIYSLDLLGFCIAVYFPLMSRLLLPSLRKLGVLVHLPPSCGCCFAICCPSLAHRLAPCPVSSSVLSLTRSDSVPFPRSHTHTHTHTVVGHRILCKDGGSRLCDANCSPPRPQIPFVPASEYSCES